MSCARLAATELDQYAWTDRHGWRLGECAAKVPSSGLRRPLAERGGRGRTEQLYDGGISGGIRIHQVCGDAVDRRT